MIVYTEKKKRRKRRKKKKKKKEQKKQKNQKNKDLRTSLFFFFSPDTIPRLLMLSPPTHQRPIHRRRRRVPRVGGANRRADMTVLTQAPFIGRNSSTSLAESIWERQTATADTASGGTPPMLQSAPLSRCQNSCCAGDDIDAVSKLGKSTRSKKITMTYVYQNHQIY